MHIWGMCFLTKQQLLRSLPKGPSGPYSNVGNFLPTVDDGCFGSTSCSRSLMLVAIQSMQMRHSNNYFRPQTSLSPQQPPFGPPGAPRHRPLIRAALPAQHRGLKTAPAQSGGSVLILRVSQGAHLLFQHQQILGWRDGNGQLQVYLKGGFHCTPNSEMFPAKMSPGKGASDEEAGEEPAGVRILSVKSSQAGTHTAHTAQEH